MQIVCVCVNFYSVFVIVCVRVCVITRLLGYSKYGVGQKMAINEWIY